MKLRQTVQPEVEHAVQLLETDLRGLWPQLNDMLDTLDGQDLRCQAPRTIHDFAQQRRELLQSVHLALIERVSGKSIEEQAGPAFQRNFFPAAIPGRCRRRRWTQSP